jgi:hypothetical protein
MPGKEACVLEVLGVRHNKAAVGLYKSFGFVHEIAYDWTSGPRFQCRDAINGSLVIMFMAKSMNSQGSFISKEELEKNLSLDFLRKKKEGEYTPRSKSVNLRVSAELLATRRSTRRRPQKALPENTERLVSDFLPDDSSEDESITSSDDEDYQIQQPSSRRTPTPKKKNINSKSPNSPKVSPSPQRRPSSGEETKARTRLSSNNTNVIKASNVTESSTEKAQMKQESIEVFKVDSEEFKSLKELLEQGYILEEEFQRRLKELKKF